MELGSKRNLGTDCLAQLRGVVAFALDGGDARHTQCTVGFGWFIDYRLCVFGCEHILVGFTLLRDVVNIRASSVGAKNILPLFLCLTAAHRTPSVSSVIRPMAKCTKNIAYAPYELRVRLIWL